MPDGANVLYDQEWLLERIATLEAERDRAREECGHAKAMHAFAERSLREWVMRSVLAKKALVATGYFTEEQVGFDLAPRITELWSELNGGSEPETIKATSDKGSS
jgi:hypothetical protein